VNVDILNPNAIAIPPIFGILQSCPAVNGRIFRIGFTRAFAASRL